MLIIFIFLSRPYIYILFFFNRKIYLKESALSVCNNITHICGFHFTPFK